MLRSESDTFYSLFGSNSPDLKLYPKPETISPVTSETLISDDSFEKLSFKNSIKISAIRLNGDAIFYWETSCDNPRRHFVWNHLTHIIVEELFVNANNEVHFGNPVIKYESELTRIRTYIPWLTQMKKEFPHLKFVWSFARCPGMIFCNGLFWENFVKLIYKEGKELFDGAEYFFFYLRF